MRVRRQLSTTLYMRNSASDLFDKLVERGELAPLFTLFLENIDTVLRIERDVEYATKHDLEDFKNTLISAVSQVISTNSTIRSVVNQEIVMEKLADLEDIVITETELIDDLSIEIGVSVEDARDDQREIIGDDDYSFEIV